MSSLPPAFILSARGRETILSETLARLAATDWPVESAPVIHLDPAPGGDPLERLSAAYGTLIAAALASCDAPYLLLLEDDLAFSRSIAARLRQWPPLRDGAIRTFASLYNPASWRAPLRRRRGGRAIPAPTKRCPP